MKSYPFVIEEVVRQNHGPQNARNESVIMKHRIKFCIPERCLVTS